MKILHPIIDQWQLEDKRVLLRIDGNVPISKDGILDDYRLQALLPTLNLLRAKGACIIMATHLGRPDKPDHALSTKHLISWFSEHDITVTFASTIAIAAKTKFQPQQVILLENLRFFPGEKERDMNFAQSLAELADYYVDDAFGALHRTDSSLTLAPIFFTPSHRSIGLLVEKEISQLHALVQNPQKPFVMALGGGKVVDKIPLIEHLIPLLDVLLISPAISSTFLVAQGMAMGSSLVDKEAIPHIQKLMEKLKDHAITLALPKDLVVAKGGFNGPLSTIKISDIKPDQMAITIGPETVEMYSEHLRQAKTIFCNGLPGTLSRPETLNSMQKLFQAIAENTHAKKIAAGGDIVGAVRRLADETAFTFLSTGGGATLTYLSGQPLPGLLALEAL